MKLIYRVVSHYPKAYKAIKIGLIVVILLLAQVFVSLFYSEKILQEQLKDESAPFTQIYAFRNEEINYPGALTWYLDSHINKEDYGIDDVVRSRAIIMSDDMFLESNEHARVKSIAGKEVTEVTGKEVAVSSAYAIVHFGSVDEAMGQTISVSVEKQSPEASPVSIEMEIASIYQHSGVNRRFLNALSDYEYDPTGGNSVYAEIIYVDEDKYLDYMIIVGDQAYVSDQQDMWGFGALRTRFVTKYTIYYDDYSLANEQRLASDLQIRSSQYDSYYVIFQSLGNIINASALMSSSISFMSGFQFISLFVLLASILFYLVFLQQIAIQKYDDTMWKLGLKKIQVDSMKTLHEVFIVALGFLVWLALNLSLLAIFGEQMLYYAEMFTFHRLIVLINLVISLIVLGVFTFGKQLINLKPGVSKLVDKKRNYTKLFTKQFYLKRLYSITPRRFLLMVLVGMLCTGSFYILSRFEPEINAIYVNEQPINYDYSVTMSYQQYQNNSHRMDDLYAMSSNALRYQEHHNNVIFTQKVQQGKTNSIKATQANVTSYGDIWEFLNVPSLPERTDEQQAAIEQNSSVILSRQLQEAMNISDSVVTDFDELYGEMEYDMETGIGTWVDDLDLYIVPPRFFQAWGNLDSSAKIRVLGFDNIIDNNGYTFYNVEHPGLVEGLQVFHDDMTPVTYYYMLGDNVKLSELKEVLMTLKDDKVIESYQLGMNESMFDYTGSDTKITSILLWVTFTLYVVLLILLVIMKSLNDKLLQANNNQVYYKLGLDEQTINRNMRFLNIMSMSSGFILGVVIVVVSMPMIRWFLYEVLVLYH